MILGGVAGISNYLLKETLVKDKIFIYISVIYSNEFMTGHAISNLQNQKSSSLDSNEFLSKS